MTDLASPTRRATEAPPAVAYTDPAVGGTATPRGKNRRRSGIVAVMVASLLLSAVTRYWADARREAAIPHRGEDASGTSLSGMNSFALGLLLGGLRGPLVMILWTDSETQKTNKNLEGVDSEIEWIRLLQPEFDTVHLFQIWNKAYNISVQLASLANKYDTILGALDYAHRVDASKPDDINIIAAMGQLYFDKLGTSSEKTYYRRRVRAEALPHSIDAAARRTDPGWRRVSLDPILDASGRPLPLLGADLPYLDNPRYEPYTDGVSTFGLAFNYYKRAERLMNVSHQHHDQLSDVVIDSRPGLSLKNWADDEFEQARRREGQAYGVAVPDDATDPGSFTAVLPLDRPAADPAGRTLAIADYDRVTRLVPDALAEYVRHIRNFPSREQQYRLYMEEAAAEGTLAVADRDYLTATAAPSAAERSRLLAEAEGAYGRTAILYDLILLHYNTDSRILTKALPPGFAVLPTAGQHGLDEMSPQQVLKAQAVANHLFLTGPHTSGEEEDRFDYERNVARAGSRIGQIEAARRGGTTRPAGG